MPWNVASGKHVPCVVGSTFTILIIACHACLAICISAKRGNVSSQAICCKEFIFSCRVSDCPLNIANSVTGRILIEIESKLRSVRRDVIFTFQFTHSVFVDCELRTWNLVNCISSCISYRLVASTTTHQYSTITRSGTTSNRGYRSHGNGVDWTLCLLCTKHIFRG